MAFALFCLAAVIRILSLVFSGGFDSVLGYDDGVYFSATLGWLHGLIPYRDFILVHPPGILLVLSPFAWLANHTTDEIGFISARIFFVILGSISTVIIYKVGEKIKTGVGLYSAIFYAVWLPVIVIDRTPYLEGVGAFALLITVYLITSNKLTRLKVVAAGASLGLAVGTKLWFAIPVAVVCTWFMVRREWLKSITFGASSVISFLLVTTPFFLLAPTKFIDLVIKAQVQRSGPKIDYAERFSAIFNRQSLSIFMGKNLSSIFIAMILLIVFIIVFKNFQLRSVEGLIIALFAAQLIVLLQTPVFFNAYPSFAATALAIIFGMSLIRMRHVRLRHILLFLIFAVGVNSSLTQAKGLTIPNKIERITYSSSDCVTSDSPAVLLLTNALSRDLKKSCQLIFDVTGVIYGIDQGSNPKHATSTYRRLKSPTYQKTLSSYLKEGSTIILARENSNGLTSRTREYLMRGRKVIRTEDFTVIIDKKAERK